MKSYVYCLLDPESGEPFYIGKSKNNDGRYERMTYHVRYFYESDYQHNRHKYNKIKKLREKGLEPKCVILKDNLTVDQANTLEKELIEKYGRSIDGGILTNIGIGGEGNTSNHRAVDQYNMFGEYVQTFPSLLEAAKTFNRKIASCITECCKHSGKSRSAWGFLWTYHDEPLDLKWCWKFIHPIEVYDQNNGFIGRYISAGETKRKLNIKIPPNRIRKLCLNGGSHKGFVFKLVSNLFQEKYSKSTFKILMISFFLLT